MSDAIDWELHYNPSLSRVQRITLTRRLDSGVCSAGFAKSGGRKDGRLDIDYYMDVPCECEACLTPDVQWLKSHDFVPPVRFTQEMKVLFSSTRYTNTMFVIWHELFGQLYCFRGPARSWQHARSKGEVVLLDSRLILPQHPRNAW